MIVEDFHIVYECNKCGLAYDGDKTIYREVFHEDSEDSDIEPEPSWKCPKHPKAIVSLLLSSISYGFTVLENDV